MVKIALCDDDINVMKQYSTLIYEIVKKHKIETQLFCFDNGTSLLRRYINTPTEIDIIYLDIIMNNMNGMETAQKLRENGCNMPIIFISAYDDYLQEAFDVEATHYLLKNDINSSTNKFEEVLLRSLEIVSKKKRDVFICKFDGKTISIPFYQISYFEIVKRLITIHYDDGKTVKFYGNMEQLENMLSGMHFVRVHRSYLVQLSYISMIQNKTLLLKTGEFIPVGSTYKQDFRTAFSTYISDFPIYNVDGLKHTER